MFNIRFTPHLRCSVEGGRLKYTQRSKQPPRDLTTPAKGFSIYFYFQNFSPTYQHVSHHPWNKFKTVSSCTWWHDHLVQFPRLCLQGNYEDGDFDIQALTWSPDMLNCPPPPKEKRLLLSYCIVPSNTIIYIAIEVLKANRLSGLFSLFT